VVSLYSRLVGLISIVSPAWSERTKAFPAAWISSSPGLYGAENRSMSHPTG
jgi:hypothetical protein